MFPVWSFTSWKFQNFRTRVKSRLTDRLSDSLTSDAEQWHNAGWDFLCPQNKPRHFTETTWRTLTRMRWIIRTWVSAPWSGPERGGERNPPAVRWAHDGAERRSRAAHWLTDWGGGGDRTGETGTDRDNSQSDDRLRRGPGRGFHRTNQ